MAAKTLRKISKSQVQVFRIQNRAGYAAILKNHLTEGKSTGEALARLRKAVKRAGYDLTV